jgi:hypothetical protein
MKKHILLHLMFISFCTLSCDKIKKESSSSSSTPLSEKSNHQTYGKAYKYIKGGWTYIHIEGSPIERGKQAGYLLAKEYQRAIKAYKDFTYQTTGMNYEFFVEIGAKLHRFKIPQEYLDEMKGMVLGLKEAGITATLDDIIGWNSFMEISGNWWPQNISKYSSYAPNGNLAKTSRFKKSKCSAFIATGSFTKDGKIVIGHNTFDDFYNAQFDNIILDCTPDTGNHFVMQSQPLYLASMQDFIITASGIVAVETTLSDFNGYDQFKTPEYVRARNAMQYANSIDEFIDHLQKDNNGGIAATWLIGDINSNEIAQFQQGLLYQKTDRKKEGYFYGFNAAFDPRIRNLECSVEQGFNDIRRHTGARRVRWPQMLEKHKGLIDVDIAKKMQADHGDVYTKKEKPSSRTICAHYDEDPRFYMSDPAATNPNPFTPAGCIDSKITTSALAKKMQFWARYGRACGQKFDKDEF